MLRSVQQRLFFPPEQAGKMGHSDNTGVSLVEYENGVWRLIYLNDNSHLTKEISTLARQNWWRGGGEDHNVWFRPAADGEERYLAYRREAWESLYGPAARFDGRGFCREALQEAEKEPLSLVYAMLGSRVAGLVQLDPERGADEGAGYISFLYLEPEYRQKRLGIQLVGQAVSFYRARGRKFLRLCVSPRNEAALRLYRAAGFKEAGSAPGQFGNLIVMEMNIGFDELWERYPLIK